MKKKIGALILIIILALACIITIICINEDKMELKSVKSEKELSKIYDESDSYYERNIFIDILTMPFSMLTYNLRYGILENETIIFDGIDKNVTMGSAANQVTETSKDYSTTNIQVENVDEADIVKTDGDYIYSISEDKVIITDVRDSKDIKIASTISLADDIPEDLILYKNKLVVILAKINNSNSYYYYNKNDTIVEIYDITEKERPKLLKSYELYEPYYTSRCIDSKLYVIASGNLREEEDEVITYYIEDNEVKEIGFDNIKYLKDVKTKKQTLIAYIDLNNIEDVNVSSYLIDISNAYVSESNIYLLNEKYNYTGDVPKISTLFGLKGAIGPFVYEPDYSDNGYKTEIYKFNIKENGKITYDNKTKLKGRTINQYSLDEYKGNFRLALYDDEGTRVVIFDENLNQLGETDHLAKGEKMYSSRFIDNKVYLVTYKTVDPLFVIDLSDETRPKVLGKLKIPGYSTYLHPYDENHLIGIGMETEEIINRDGNGKVISTTARITGMKMALFDVSDVNNPIQISNTLIGDSRTTSAILTNPKALLFSKAKNLIAIPVNNYEEDFEIKSSGESYSSIIDSYKNYKKEYVAEGYFVYDINLEQGFNLKGVITHEKNTNHNIYSNRSKLLRGLYIDDNLYTVSETAIKVNKLNNLELVSELKIK